jgi:hypothetical protein
LKKVIEPRVIRLFLMMKPENRNRAHNCKTFLNDESSKKNIAQSSKTVLNDET